MENNEDGKKGESKRKRVEVSNRELRVESRRWSWSKEKLGKE